jgi:hypothetical protein
MAPTPKGGSFVSIIAAVGLVLLLPKPWTMTQTAFSWPVML